MNKKEIKIILILIAIAIGLGAVWYFNKNLLVSYKDATYQVENSLVTLKDGVSIKEIAPGSASKITTRYFGNEAVGDLNGDGKNDIAFILTQEGNGSGTFFYLAVALKADKGYQGINAVLLGDRIAPQTTMIADQQVIVNFADRALHESMVTPPSIGVSKKFKVAYGRLTEIVETASITDTTLVESYVRTNIKTIAPEKPVLGGTWYVVSVKVDETKKTGSVVYEDGHIQGEASFVYARDGASITISQIKNKKK
jgi:hypothetical protein